MPIPYKHKRSTAAGVAPSTLQDGEIAINVAASDPKLFYKDSSSTIRAFSLASYASASHTHVVADVTDFTTKANVVSVNAKTGVVSISHTDVTAASASHTHAASDITSGTLDAARLPLATTIAAGAVIVGTGLGVSSGTVSVSYGTTSGTACQGNDSRLSDARTPTSHSHGNITNAGAIGSTANLPIITTTSGVLTTGSFGTTAATFCEGNDSRLSDARTPTDGSVTTAKLANDAVTYAKLQNVSATDRLLGRSSAGSGDVEEITCGSFGRSLIGSADATAARTTLSVQPTASPTFTGTVTVPGLTATAAILADDLSSANSVVYSFDGDPNSGIGRAGADIVTVVTAGVEQVRVDASGNVGIGKSPSYRLDVLGDLGIDSAGNAVLRYGRNNSYKWAIYNDTSDNFIFYSDAAFAERLRISSTGEVIVGTTNQGAYNLQCNGTGVWGAGAYVNGSDERIKDEIAPIDEATSVITAMQPVTFRYKPTWSSDQSIQPGFIAQQLQEALAGTPYLDGVVQQGTEYLSVAYQSLIPLLVKALQESNARIAALEERNHA